MGFARKIRKKRQRPPLSALDKFIYYSGYVGAVTLGIFIIALCGRFIPNKIAFADASVIAAANETALYCCLPLAFIIIFILALLPLFGLTNKQPIFENKHFKTKPSHPTEKVYPLFSKEFRNSISRRRKRTIKIVAIIISTISIVNIVFLPFSFNRRDVLHKSNYYSTYNIFNQTTHKQNITEAEKMIIEATKNTHRTHGISYRVVIRFVFNDKTYSFRHVDFNISTEETLKHMIYLKSLFKGSKYEIVHADYIDNLIRKESFSHPEAALVYQLFDYK